MKFLKSYLVQLGFVSLALVSLALLFNGTIKSESNHTIQSFDDNWTYKLDGGDVYYDTLPDYIETNGSSEIVLEKTLPDTIEYSNAINFFTIHQSVHAYVDGNLIYDFGLPLDSRSKTPGNSWNLVELNENYGKKTIRIVIDSSYDNQKVNVPEMYYGSSFEMLKDKLKNAILPLFVSGLMLVCGLVVLVLGTLLRTKMDFGKEILWLGLFASMLSIWSLMETQILPVLFGHNLIYSQITFLCLKLAIFPIVRFVIYIYDLKKSKVIDLICIASMLDVVGTSILQLLGIADFSETVFITHLIYAVAVISLFCFTVEILRDKDSKSKRSKAAIINSVCISIVGITTFIDILRFYFLQSPDSAKYGRIGLMIYVLVLTVFVLSDSIRLIHDGRQMEDIKEIALVDGLTKVKNRNAYQQEIARIEKEKFFVSGIVMFDLNNLKYFNDVYGHSIGDYYIIICSEIIMDIFSKYGEVYRIGGDEFCAVVYELSMEEFLTCQIEMAKRVNGLNVQFIENCMAIASGYAIFDETIDGNLNETAQRADQKMYEKKAKMKKNQIAN